MFFAVQYENPQMACHAIRVHGMIEEQNEG